MSEKQPNELMSFSSFADWCRHIDSLSESAKHTVKVLLGKPGFGYGAQAAERIVSSMTTLDLRDNGISDINSLGSLTNLTTLYLSNNEITDISSLGSLTNLRTLHLDNNEITDISSLGSLTNLTTLYLSNNQITEIDIGCLGSLTNLRTLYLDSNPITDINFLGSLTNLTTLNLDRTQITDITVLYLLTNLTRLDLRVNRITSISALRSLTNLTELYLSNNQITDISALRALTNLRTLHLGNNQITDISALRALTNLTELHLGNNQITDISALRSLTNLTHLDLNNNQIPALCVLGELAQKRLTVSTKPIDAQKATEAVKVAYAAIGLGQPEVIICRSPRDICLQFFNFLRYEHSPNSSYERCRNRLGKNLSWKWMSRSIVREFASPGVWEYELDRMTIEPEADRTIRLLMDEFVDSYELSEQTKGNVSCSDWCDLKFPSTSTTLCKEIYLAELYVSSSGVNLSLKAQAILRSQKLIFEHWGWIFPFEKICFVCHRPRYLRFDSQNRLHAEAEPAIEFADGWNFYYYHGVRLPEKYGKVHPNKWQSKWLLAEENAQLRQVLIQGIGEERIGQEELQAKQIDSWPEYVLNWLRSHWSRIVTKTNR